MRHWRFKVKDWNGSVFYLDEYGQHIDSEMANLARAIEEDFRRHAEEVKRRKFEQAHQLQSLNCRQCGYLICDHETAIADAVIAGETKLGIGQAARNQEGGPQ